MTALTRADLDGAHCNDPGCAGCDQERVLYMHARCHPNAGTRASYDKRTGVLALTCRACAKPIVEFAVARAPEAS